MFIFKAATPFLFFFNGMLADPDAINVKNAWPQYHNFPVYDGEYDKIGTFNGKDEYHRDLFLSQYGVTAVGDIQWKTITMDTRIGNLNKAHNERLLGKNVWTIAAYIQSQGAHTYRIRFISEDDVADPTLAQNWVYYGNNGSPKSAPLLDILEVSLDECSNFGDCDVACGGGSQTCENTCNNSVWGKTKVCSAGNQFNTQPCNVQECPKDEPIPEPNPSLAVIEQAITERATLSAAFESAFGSSNKFADNNGDRFEKISKRMVKFYTKFQCPGSDGRKKRSTDVVSRTRRSTTCDDILSAIDALAQWNTDHLATCKDADGKAAKKSQNIANSLQRNKKKVQKFCPKAMAKKNKDAKKGGQRMMAGKIELL